MTEYDDNLLLGYVEDDLSEAQRATVEKWIADDPRLEALLRGMIADRQALRDLSEPDAPAWVLDDVDHGLERSMLLQDHARDQQQVVRQRHVARRMLTGLAMAAMVLLAVSVVLWSIMDTGGNLLHYTEVAKAPAHGAMTDTEVARKPGPEVAWDTDALGRSDNATGDTDHRLSGISKDAPSPVATKGTANSGSGHNSFAFGQGEGIASKSGSRESMANSKLSDLSAGVSLRADDDTLWVKNGNNTTGVADGTMNKDLDLYFDQPVQVIVQTNDMSRTVAQLEDLARTIPNGRLVAEAPDVDLPDQTKKREIAAINAAGGGIDKLGTVPANQPTGVDAVQEAIDRIPGEQAKRQSGDKAKPAERDESSPATSQTVAAAPATAPVAKQGGNQTDSQNQYFDPLIAQRDKVGQTPSGPVSLADTNVSVRLNYQLVVPADQLQNTLGLLQAPSFNNTLQNVAVGQVRATPAVRLSRRNADYWPNRSPDYAAILREQLPEIQQRGYIGRAGTDSKLGEGEEASAVQSPAATSLATSSPVAQTEEYKRGRSTEQSGSQVTANQRQAATETRPADTTKQIQHNQQLASQSQTATVTVPIVIEMQTASTNLTDLPAELQQQTQQAESPSQVAPNPPPAGGATDTPAPDAPPPAK